MDTYIDELKKAKLKGILMDSCGLSERYYKWGMYDDLCGMSVEDYMPHSN